MKVPIPNRIIRLVFKELIYLNLKNTVEFKPIGIGYHNAIRGCVFGKNMVDRAIEEIINLGLLESNNKETTINKSQYRFTEKGKSLIKSGNYEEIFKNSITKRKFFFNNWGEYGFSDIYKKKLLQWKLMKFEIEVDPITLEYFNIAKHLNYQIWKSKEKIYLVSKYIGHIRMFEIPDGLITNMKLEIYSKGKEPSKIRLLIDDKDLRGTILEGNINEINWKDYEYKVREMEHKVIPEILKIFNAVLTETKTLVNV